MLAGEQAGVLALLALVLIIMGWVVVCQTEASGFSTQWCDSRRWTGGDDLRGGLGCLQQRAYLQTPPQEWVHIPVISVTDGSGCDTPHYV